MELEKTRCENCGHLRRWHSYKWANTPERQAFNREGHSKCVKCGSTNVTSVEDEEIMVPYNFAARLLMKGDGS